MEKFKLSSNGQKLIHLYETMTTQGYNRSDGSFVKNAYDDFELKKFRNFVLPHFKELTTRSVLDIGSGGSDWEEEDFNRESRQSARNICQRKNPNV